MKKLFCFVLITLLLISVCFTGAGCKAAFNRTGFFKSKILKSEGVAGLERPNYTLSFSGWTSTHGMIERAEFDRYAQYVLDFLTERYDYVGTEGYEYGTFFGGAGTYKFKECDTNDLSTYIYKNDSRSCEYIFVYFIEKPIEGDQTQQKIELEYYYNPVSYLLGDDKKGPEFNFQMSFNNFYGITDKYIFTSAEPFEIHNFGEEAVDGIIEPVVNVIRTEEKWNEIFSDRWYSSYCPDFSKNFMISIFINCPEKETCTYYHVQSVVKNNNGGYTIKIEMWGTTAYTYTAWNILIELEEYVNIYDVSDLTIQFVQKSDCEMPEE